MPAALPRVKWSKEHRESCHLVLCQLWIRETSREMASLSNSQKTFSWTTEMLLTMTEPKRWLSRQIYLTPRLIKWVPSPEPTEWKNSLLQVVVWLVLTGHLYTLGKKNPSHIHANSRSSHRVKVLSLPRPQTLKSIICVSGGLGWLHIHHQKKACLTWLIHIQCLLSLKQLVFYVHYSLLLMLSDW